MDDEGFVDGSFVRKTTLPKKYLEILTVDRLRQWYLPDDTGLKCTKHWYLPEEDTLRVLRFVSRRYINSDVRNREAQQ